MQFMIYEDNGGDFHWCLVGDDGVESAVSATGFKSPKAAQRAADKVHAKAGSASGAEG